MTIEEPDLANIVRRFIPKIANICFIF
jgi:hypothetical protein